MNDTILQMVKDRISQSPHVDEGMISLDAAIKCIDEVASATGNRCTDDSLWFSGKEWQAKESKIAILKKQVDILVRRIKCLNVNGDACEYCECTEPESLCVNKCADLIKAWSLAKAKTQVKAPRRGKQ